MFFFLLVFSILIFLVIITFVYFASVINNKLIINDKQILLINKKNSSAINFNEVVKIKIKRRTNGIIREIYLWTRSGKSLFINAFENNFEEIERTINNSLDKEIQRKDLKELIDLDHILFYPILGSVISFSSILFINTILKVDEKLINIFFYTVSLYSFALGLFFVFTKPISARSAKRSGNVDLVFGVLFVIFSILVLFNIF